ncbi:hypothetical protein TWF106_011016 [Orbilia oligospora]|uniref:F-box domain-containing protein n=1 Tax=Orbilia oligospora TaxID=2813651 RepID=A0A7C8QG60_ORBOL|nr:hypothetical protein TWF106_011016 [Orbilia oligospora]
MNHLKEPSLEVIKEQTQSGLLTLPNEILAQIFEECLDPPLTLFWDDNAPAYATSYSRHRKFALQVLPIVLTCRRFRDHATPLLYRFCSLQYQAHGHRDIYRWIPCCAGTLIPRKYALYKSYGPVVRSFCFNEGPFADTMTARDTSQEIPTIIPQFLSPLFASFSNLKEARFHSENYLKSTTQVQTYTDGIHSLLATCLSLEKLSVCLAASPVVCSNLKYKRREKLQEGLDASSSCSLASPHANLTELHLSCDDAWESERSQIEDREAAFSVLELFCDIVWPSAKTITTFKFGYAAVAMFAYSGGIMTNVDATPLTEYDLPMLEHVSIPTPDSSVLAAFDAFFNFDGSRIKSVEVRDMYIYASWSFEDSEHGIYADALDVEFISRYSNIERISIRNIAEESDWGQVEGDGICSILLRLFLRKPISFKGLAEINLYLPRDAEALIEVIKCRFADRSLNLTRFPKDSDYSAHIVFPLDG